MAKAIHKGTDSMFRDLPIYQVVLDRIAEQQINSVERLVGIKTAMSPSPLVDCAFVVLCGFALFGTFCQLHHQGTGKGMLTLRPGSHIQRLLRLVEQQS